MKCSFCGKEFGTGTGKMYVLNSGKIFYFCSSKCEKNQLKLKRKSRLLKWTSSFQKAFTGAKKIDSAEK